MTCLPSAKCFVSVGDSCMGPPRDAHRFHRMSAQPSDLQDTVRADEILNAAQVEGLDLRIWVLLWHLF